MPNSYNGWPASPDPAAIGIDTNWSVLGTRPFKDGGFAGGMKSGDVATIFTELVTRLHNEVEPMMRDPDTGQLGYGCWAYQYRANVNNPSQLSCHASATAIDYNAPRHPNGTVAPGGRSGWTTAQAEKIRGIIADLGGVVRWLWSNDPMHFEIIGSVAEVAAVAARIRREPGKPNPPTPSRPAPTTPTPQPIDLEVDMLNVIRDKTTGVDYLVGAPFVFVMIENDQAYNRYLDAKMIDVPHGQAPAFEPFEVAWYRNKIVAWRAAAGLPGAADVEPVYGYTPAN